MATAPEQEVIDAIERGNTEILRRADIYESDAKTLWYPSSQLYVPDEELTANPPESRLVDGTVTVDYSRSERRALDMTLENEDNLLRVNPHDGLWYDKVLKVFRGLRYASDPLPPRIAIVEADDDAQAYKTRNTFLQLGFTRTEVFTFAEFLYDIVDYEIIVSAMEFGATQKGELLRHAYASGKKVITLSRYNSDVEIPFITDAVYRADAPWGIMPVAYDTPVKDSTVSTSTDTNYISNPSFQSTGLLITLDENLVINPSFEVDTSHWNVGGQWSGGAIADADAVDGSNVVELTATQDATSGSAAFIQSGADRISIDNTKPYSVTFWVRRMNAEAPSQVRLLLPSYDINSTFLGSYSVVTNVDLPIGEWVELKGEDISDWIPDTAQVVIGVYPASSDGVAGGILQYDAAMMIQGTFLPEHFNGDTPDDSTFTYSWTGIASGSTSIRQALAVADWEIIQGDGYGGAIWKKGNGDTVVRCGSVYSFARLPVPELPNTEGTTTVLVDTIESDVDTTIYVYLSGSPTDRIPVNLIAGQPTEIRLNYELYGTYVYIGWSYGFKAPGAHITFNRALLTLGNFQGNYFDGDSPRAYWTGTPHASTSVQTNTVTEGWGSEDYGTAEGWLPMAVDGTATVVATYLDGSTTYYAAIVAEHTSGGRWFDYHPYELGSQSKLLLRNATNWAWNYSPYKEWTVQVGEFVVDRISEANFPHQVKITGRDYAKKCITSRLEKAASFPAGTAVDELIAALAANAGITKMKLSTQVEPLPTRMDIERGTPRWEVMEKAAQANNLEIFFDNQGFLVTRPFVDPAYGALSWTFRTGSKGNLVEFNRSTDDSRLYNHIVVTGERENEDELPYFGEAKNTEPSSPTRIERIGDRAYFFTSSFFTNNQQCQELAESWLKIHALESYEMDWSSINYPWLEVGEVVEFLDPRRSEIEPTRYLLNTLNIPLGLGPMSATGKRVTLVGEENTDIELPPEEGDVVPEDEEPAA